MEEVESYKKLIGEIIQKQADILGKEMAIGRASQVSGLKIDDSGQVLKISGDPQDILEKLVSQYIALSGEIVKNILNSVFVKYPNIKLNLE